MHRRRRLAITISLILVGLWLCAAPVSAWPGVLMESLSRDARRLVPRTLARLLGERETEIFDAMRRFPVPVAQPLARDLSAGQLRPETVALLESRVARSVELIRERRVSEGLVEMGALLRIPADLADPVLSVGSSGMPPGVAGEYYAFVERSLPKIPVVLYDRGDLELQRDQLPAYWQQLLSRSRPQSPVIRAELFRDGRVVSQRRIDHRNPVFGVASLSYSRAVNGIAATWLAVWREVRGDVTRMPRPREIVPRDDPVGSSSDTSEVASP